MERERSPNYPAYGLESAIKFVRRAYSRVKRVAVPMEHLAVALGSEGKALSGPSRSKIAALRSFGLVEKSKDGLRISDLAMPLILKEPPDQEFFSAAIEAALSPSLFADLYAHRFEMDDKDLTYYLITGPKFSPDGARKAVKSFRETMAFANLHGQGYTPGSTPVALQEPPMVTPAAHVNVNPSAAARAAYEAAQGLTTDSVVLQAEGLYDARIRFPHGASKSAIAKVRLALKFLEDQYPDDVPEAPKQQVVGDAEGE